MKNRRPVILLPAMMVLAFGFCKAQSTKPSAADSVIGNAGNSEQSVDYPYPMLYSANFRFIDPLKGKMVLDFCKDFENNTLISSKMNFADTVALALPKLRLKADRDSVISALTMYRRSFVSFKTEIDVVMSVRSIDKGDDWVLVWAVDSFTDQYKINHSVKYQQVWLINKEGKISFMEQFDRILK